MLLAQLAARHMDLQFAAAKAAVQPALRQLKTLQARQTRTRPHLSEQAMASQQLLALQLQAEVVILQQSPDQGQAAQEDQGR